MFAQLAIENWSVKLSAFNARQDAAAEDVDVAMVKMLPEPERGPSQSQSQAGARAGARELAVFVLTLNEIICDDCALVAVSSRPRRRQNGQQTDKGGEATGAGGYTEVPG